MKQPKNSSDVIVLAMHGALPTDFPQAELDEFFSLHARMNRSQSLEKRRLKARHQNLEKRLRAWPRTERNDPFYAGSRKLAAKLSQITGNKVILGFNEFCDPNLDDALDQALQQAPGKVVVVTSMLIRGGKHSENEIPAAIQRAEKRHPNTPIVYIWPYDNSDIAQFLATQSRMHAK